MEVDREDFDWAVSEGLISPEQAELLWQALSRRAIAPPDSTPHQPRFDFANVAYYCGALIVISAMGWFMTRAWESFGGGGLFAIACFYALGFVMAGKRLYFQQNLKVPGGLLFTMAVGMTPLAIYGLQRWTGFWLQGDPGVYRDFHTWIKGSWFLMEVGTILAGLVALKFVRFPFLTAPIAFCLWYLSMDIAPLLLGETADSWKQRAQISMWFGIACLVTAYWVDLRSRRSQGDYAFWLYLFGLMSFWFSLPFIGADSELQRFLYCLINLGLMLLSVLLKRRVFIVFGGLGVFGYLSDLSYRLFADSLLFPFVLSIVGIAIIYLGVLYQRHYKNLDRYLDRVLPEGLKQLLPRER